ncbi:MAG: type II toxin-antitoxin system VapC family toxin [Capsulimonadaceae bacterium]
MAKSPRKYYWDTSVFLMLLKGETLHGQDTLDAAKDIFRKVEQGDAIIITSEMTVVEILESKTDQAAFDRWEAALQWENLHVRAVDHPVAVRAQKLRSECDRQKSKPVTHSEDAIHVATYLIYRSEIDELHSLDPDFAKALKYCGETVVPTKPRRDQTTLETELFADDDDDLETDDYDENGTTGNG